MVTSTTASTARPSPRRRVAWYRDSIETLVQRDVRDMARISSLDVLPRLLTFAAGQTARLTNVSDLASPFHLSRPTIREYVTLLARDRMMLGQLLETFVFQELRRQASGHEDEIRFYHFRDKDGAEVDVVVEHGARHVAGVEVKASATVTAADFHGLRKLRASAGHRFTSGVVLYDGETSVGFGEGLHAVPIRGLWEAM